MQDNFVSFVENLRQYSLDVEEVEMKMNPLVKLTVEEVVTLRVTRI